MAFRASRRYDYQDEDYSYELSCSSDVCMDGWRDGAASSPSQTLDDCADIKFTRSKRRQDGTFIL